MISHSHQFLFLHLTRSGGHSIGKVLMPYCVDVQDPDKTYGPEWYDLLNTEAPHLTRHASWREYREHYGPRIDRYRVVVATRNPWDRAVSFHMWRQRQRNREFDREVFLRDVTKMRTYRDLLTGDDRADDVRVDRAIRYERINEDFLELLEFLKLPRADLPHINASRHTHYTDYYDEQMIEAVSARCAFQIEVFGYTFET